MTIATTQTYRAVAVRAADLDTIIQIQEVRGWDFVTAFPTATGTDEQPEAEDSDEYDNAQDEVEDDTNDSGTDRGSEYIMIFRKRSRR